MMKVQCTAVQYTQIDANTHLLTEVNVRPLLDIVLCDHQQSRPTHPRATSVMYQGHFPAALLIKACAGRSIPASYTATAMMRRGSHSG